MKAAEANQYKQVLASLDKGIALSNTGIGNQEAEFRSKLLFYKQTVENTRKVPQSLFDEELKGIGQEMSGKAPHLVKQPASLQIYRQLVAALRGGARRFSTSLESHVIAFNAPMRERALLNLLSNALKFTPEGGTVSVRVKCGERHVQLTVADTGRGIEPERLAHIFERYLDTDRLDPAPPHGLGFGLSLCRRIAQGHGGMRVAESAVGKGTVFTLSLPNARSTDLSLSDRRFDYAGGFDHVLMELSDALPSRAFLQKYLD